MGADISIFNYIEYQKYLTEWRCAEKKKNPGLTHEYLCYKLGRKSRTLFNDIEKGRKKISPDLLNRLVALLELAGDEAKYLRAIVNYGQETGYKEKEYWFEKILELNAIPKMVIDIDSYSFFKDWYHTTIRAMLDIYDFKDEYELFAEKIYHRLTPTQIKHSIELLQRLNLIAENEQGYLKPNDKVVSADAPYSNKILNKYLISNHEIFSDILKKDEPGSYDSSLYTLSLSPEGFQHLMQRVQQFKKELSSIAHNDQHKANRVYKVSVYAYPEIVRREDQ